jgi:hypothetical protein
MQRAMSQFAILGNLVSNHSRWDKVWLDHEDNVTTWPTEDMSLLDRTGQRSHISLTYGTMYGATHSGLPSMSRNSVVDWRNIPILKAHSIPTPCTAVTHSLRPCTAGTHSLRPRALTPYVCVQRWLTPYVRVQRWRRERALRSPDYFRMQYLRHIP